MDVDTVIQAIHEHGPRWAQRSGEAERVGAISPETAAELRALDAHRSLQPAEFGGLQDSFATHTRIMAAIGEYCGSAAWCAGVWSAHNWMVGLLPPETQAELWADPAALISASIVPKTPFDTDGDDVIVKGRFAFASGCDHAEWLGVGGLAQWDSPTPVICVLPAGQIEIDAESWNVIGLAGTGSKDLVIDEPIRVPAHRVLRTPQAATRQAPGQQGHDRTLYRAPFRPTAIIVLAAPVIGLTKATLRRFQERLDGHVLMAHQGSQRSDPAAALRLAESAAEAHAAELVLLDACHRLDRLAATDEPDPVVVASIARDTAYSVRLCASAVDRLYEASGGSALRIDEPIQRYWRDVHAARSHAVLTWDGAAETYAAALLGG